MNYCTKCGAPVDEDMKFCRKCGNRLIFDNDENDKITDDISDIGGYNTNKLENQDTIKNSDVGNITERINIPRETLNDNIESRVPKNNNKIKYGITAGIIAVIILIVAVSSNRISSAYYKMKCRNAITASEKIDYASKALRAYGSEDNRNLLKDILIETSDNNLDVAEQKLKDISNMLNQNDIKDISIKIKEKKVDNYCSKSHYEEALTELDELYKFGEDFKSNKHYDDIMLNVISKLTGTAVKPNKDALMEDNGICYDNFDGDPFDSLIEVKNGDPYKYNPEIKLNLYKFKDGQYKLTDTKTISNAYNKEIQGVYEYVQGINGLFLKYNNSDSLNTAPLATSVYGVEDERLVLKGTIYGNDYTKPDDINNDGIYEVLSCSKSFITSTPKETKKWYSIKEDGSTPKEISSDDSNSNSISKDSDSSYIFKNSDKEYLTEEDVRGLTKEKLALARNEIFARHGYIFKEEPYVSYFEGKSWYTKNPNYDGDDSILNEYEIANYKLIQNWENR